MRTTAIADAVSMPTLVSLEYPNGRTHLAEVSEDDLTPGAEFELYGRRWRAVGPVPSRYAPRFTAPAERRVLCRQAS